MSIAVGVSLAAVSACCYALAATLQHGVVQAVTDHQRLRSARLKALLAEPRWLGGALAQIVGGGLHVWALSNAPLMVVQPVAVVAIGLTTLGRAVLTGTRPDRTTLTATLVSMLGIGVFVAYTAHHASPHLATPLTQARILLLIAPAVAAALLLSRTSNGRVRCALLATAGGLCFGVVSTLVQTVTYGLHTHHLVLLGAVPVVIAAAILGCWSVQQAYTVGNPETVVAIETITDPLIGVLIGGFVLHEITHLSSDALTGQLIGGALAIAGVIALARHNTQQNRTPGARRETRVSTTSPDTDKPAATVTHLEVLPAVTPHDFGPRQRIA